MSVPRNKYEKSSHLHLILYLTQMCRSITYLKEAFAEIFSKSFMLLSYVVSVTLTLAGKRFFEVHAV